MVRRPWPPAPDAGPEQLSAWHGAFGHYDYLRKVILADCKLVARGKAAEQGGKITNDQADDEAHTSDDYVQFLIDGLNGRIAYEKMVAEQRGAV